ncbi:MAG: hypothetical protein V2J12_05035 [Gammaproteobacteria bacterium]|jgi:hypothetical protein|nr:hypothetical protein [Gammaproteobacteria bacterium]
MDSNRLLMQLEQTRKEINREIINPEIKTLSLKDLEPVVRMVAYARAAYVEELFRLAAETGGNQAPDDIEILHALREKYEELVTAANAMETMIKRGYVDVAGKLEK